MSKKLCVCLTEKTNQECISFVKSSDADLIEHRMDFMDEISGLKEIYSASSIPIIATCRSREMDGSFDGDESQRISHLLDAIESGVSYVDIEIEVEEEYLERIRNAARQNDCQIIISKHYTQLTPDKSELHALIDKMKNSGADTIKIVVTPESISDCRRILELYSLEGLETPLIAFAMSEMGKFTRVSALYLGAPFMYVSQDSGRVAASGQISLNDMRTILRKLS
ncbi:MAG: type I 3-dehydroquinate dehydratase [Candidatus Thorarchaeota archaeon]|jgi:3-dehydroquinate dehydratase type I